jgi:hypothetical protein
MRNSIDIITLTEIKMRLLFLSAIACCFLSASVHAQNPATGQVAINDLGANADAAAVLDVMSTSQGMLIPRMRQTDRVAIAAPATGLLVYQDDNSEGFWYYDGSVWLPWTKDISASVSMTPGTSTIIKGGGFTTTRLIPGRDQVTFATPYTDIPDLTLSAEGLPGEAPRAPFDFCFTSYENCTDVHIRFIRLKTTTAASTAFMETGPTVCNPASNNYTSYNLSDAQYSSTPNFPTPAINTGANFYLNASRSASASAANRNVMTLWMDWNHDGSFDNSEVIQTETGGVVQTALASFNNTFDFPINVPAGACNGITTGRLTVRDVIDASAPPSCNNEEVRGETEDFEVIINSATNCTAAYPAKLINCNVFALTNSGFRVNCTDRSRASINGKYNFKVVEQ